MKDLVIQIINSKLFRILFKPIDVFHRFISTIFYIKSNNQVNDQLLLNYTSLNEKIVLNGPFKGMKYGSVGALCSTFIPKIIGSYECELHTVIQEIIINKYTEVWDIGCAEGYYAVGLALKIPNAKVIAFDIDPDARKNCFELAKINSVTERVSIIDKCDANFINNYNFENGLILSDCEGFELEMFENVNLNETKFDCLIEIHEWPLERNVEKRMIEFFSPTHEVIKIYSKSDIRKAKEYSFIPFEANKNISIIDRFNAFKECRGDEMLWIFCKRKFY
jgi:hypothetical protein